MTNEERISKIHERVNKIGESVSKLYGGLAVVAFVIVVVGSMIAHHINYRFSSIEKSLDKIEQQVTKGHHKWQPETKITSVSP